jgi:hypothetical protein
LPGKTKGCHFHHMVTGGRAGNDQCLIAASSSPPSASVSCSTRRTRSGGRRLNQSANATALADDVEAQAETLAQRAQETLRQGGVRQNRRLSTELNGLYGLYDDQLTQTRGRYALSGRYRYCPGAQGRPIGHFRVSNSRRASCTVENGALRLRRYGKHAINDNP